MNNAIGWVWGKASHRRRRTTRLKVDDYAILFKSIFFGVVGTIALVAGLVTGDGRGWGSVGWAAAGATGVFMVWSVVTEPKAVDGSQQ